MFASTLTVLTVSSITWLIRTGRCKRHQLIPWARQYLPYTLTEWQNNSASVIAWLPWMRQELLPCGHEQNTRWATRPLNRSVWARRYTARQRVFLKRPEIHESQEWKTNTRSGRGSEHDFADNGHHPFTDEIVTCVTKDPSGFGILTVWRVTTCTSCCVFGEKLCGNS